MILVDTSGIVSAIDEGQRLHADCARVLYQTEPRILSPFVLAEVDYMIGRIAGSNHQLAFLDDVAQGAYTLAPFDNEDVQFAHEIASRYRDLNIGLTDASIVVLAARYDCWDVLTLDERHFRALRVPGVKQPFRILPADLSP